MKDPGEPTRLSDEAMHNHWQTLARFFTAYQQGYTQPMVNDVQHWWLGLEGMRPSDVTKTQQMQLLSLQSWYHRLLAGLARDEENAEQASLHADIAVGLAEQALTRHTPPSEKDALPCHPHVLLTAAFLWRADLSYERRDDFSGEADLERVLTLLPIVHQASADLRGITARGVRYLQHAQMEMERVFLFSVFHLTLQLEAFRPLRSTSFVPDEPHTHEHGALLRLWEEASDEPDPTLLIRTLMNARQSASPDQARLHATSFVFLAVCAFGGRDYQQAVEFALAALGHCRLIRCRPLRDRISALYRLLVSQSSEPSIADLGTKLRTWDGELE